MNVLEGDLYFHTMWEPEFKLIHFAFLEAKRLLLTQVLLYPRIWKVTFLLGSQICIQGLSFLINFVNFSWTFGTWVLSSPFNLTISFNYSFNSFTIIKHFWRQKCMTGNEVLAKDMKMNKTHFLKILIVSCGNQTQIQSSYNEEWWRLKI